MSANTTDRASVAPPIRVGIDRRTFIGTEDRSGLQPAGPRPDAVAKSADDASLSPGEAR